MTPIYFLFAMIRYKNACYDIFLLAIVLSGLGSMFSIMNGTCLV